jgi:hypothetical protein
MGIMINEELGIQNEMLGLVEEDVDRVQGKIDVGRRRWKRRRMIRIKREMREGRGGGRRVGVRVRRRGRC